MEIRLNKRGLITQGESAGLHVLVEPQKPVGYLILVFNPDRRTKEGWDVWHETLEGVEQAFKFYNWEVKWLE